MELILSLSIFVTVICLLKTRALVREIEALENMLEEANEELRCLEEELSSYKTQTPLDLTGLFVHK